MYATALLYRAVIAAAAPQRRNDVAYASAVAQALLATSRTSSSGGDGSTAAAIVAASSAQCSSDARRGGRAAAALTSALRKHARHGEAHDAHSLAAFCPAIAHMWLAASSSKLLQPHHVRPDSRKLAWWCCSACGHQFSKRIDRHVADGGVCPRCASKPSLGEPSHPTPTPTHPRQRQQQPPSRRRGAHARLVTAARTSAQRRRRLRSGTTAVAVVDAASVGGVRVGGRRAEGLGGAPPGHVVVHRCRPDNSLDSLAAPNANLVKASVADGLYLRVQERRNLQPMLAKNYEHEKHKIAASEVLYVSPKLDGVRCIVAYDAQQQRVLFFSRSGTLFECCDAAIEPALRYAFACDPTLVLDGELYNDDANQAQLRTAMALHTRAQRRGATHACPSPLQQLLHLPTTTAAAASRPCMSFDQLTSAVRTTRERRTAEVAALQAQLQYHVFDVLYAAAFDGGCGSCVPYAQRCAYVARLLDALHAHNKRVTAAYDSTVVRLLPSLRCVKADVATALRDATLVGYEGVMVRRTGLDKDDDDDDDDSTAAQRPRRGRRCSRSRGGAHGAGEGAVVVARDGYAYGRRSDMLLKYKRMHDDEFVIVDALEGKGKWRGCLGAFVCTTRDRRHTFTAAPASTDDEKRRMWQCWRSAYKGKALTVQYQELSPDGIPRFPVAKCVRGAPSGKDWI